MNFVLLCYFCSLFLLNNAIVAATFVKFGQVAAFSGSEATAGELLKAGVLAAFKEANDAGGVKGAQLQLVAADDKYDKTKSPIAAANLYAANPDIVAWVGGYGSPTTTALIAFLESAKMVSVGPMTGSTVFRKTFTPNIINIRASYDDEVYVTLNFLVFQMSIRRIAMFYQNDAFGIPAMEALVLALPELGLQPTITIPYDVSNGVENFDVDKHVEMLLSTEPEAVMIFSVNSFGAALVSSLLEKSPTVLCVFGSFSISVTKLLSAHNVDPTRVYISEVLPHPDDTSRELVRNYRAALGAYLGAGVTFDYQTLEGYLSGRLAVEILRSAKNFSKEAFFEIIYKQGMFSLDDFRVGPYSNDCRITNTESYGRSSLCFCNQGLRLVELNQVTRSFTLQLRSETAVEYSIAECYGTPRAILKKISAFEQIVINSPHGTRAANLMASGATLFKSTKDINLLRSNFSAKHEAEELVAKAQHFWNLTGLVFSVGYTPNSSMATFAALQTPAQLSLPFSKANVRITASLEQEVFAAVHHVKQSAIADKTIHLLLASAFDNPAEATKMFHQTVETHRLPIGQMCIAPGQINQLCLQNIFGGSGTIVVLGMTTTAELYSLATLLGGYPHLQIVLPFDDMAYMYDAIRDCSQEPASAPQCSPSVLSRMLFSTNLAPWRNTTEGATNTLTQQFLAARGNDGADSHPLEVLGYFTARALNYVLDRVEASSSEDLLSSWYRLGVIPLTDDDRIGPYNDIPCGSVDCLCNLGPRTLVTRSLVSLILGADGDNNTEESSVFFPTCFIDYDPLPSEDSKLAIVIGGSAAALFVLIAAGAGTILFRLRSKRNNANAPKNRYEDFAIVFTDIQSSTALWARAPEHMGVALDLHHELIRKAITKHNGYEVKTIGDSFMVAFVNPIDAIQFGLFVQTDFFAQEWPPEIDECYKEMQLEAAENEEEATATATTTPGNDYSQWWKGLRVRIGIHYGQGDIKFDENTQGYDYYGTVVNTAARVEAVGNGGQVLITSTVLEHVGRRNVTDAIITDLGLQNLRGLSTPIGIAQVIPKPLHGRAFGALRLDKAAHVDTTDSETENGSNATGGSGIGDPDVYVRNRLAGGAQRGSVKTAHELDEFYYLSGFFKTVMSTCSKDYREKLFQHLMKKWRIPGAHNLQVPMMEAKVFVRAFQAYDKKTAQDRRRKSSLHVPDHSINESYTPSLGGHQPSLGAGSFIEDAPLGFSGTNPERRPKGGPVLLPVQGSLLLSPQVDGCLAITIPGATRSQTD